LNEKGFTEALEFIIKMVPSMERKFYQSICHIALLEDWGNMYALSASDGYAGNGILLAVFAFNRIRYS
jgi:hypothetical protein